MGNNALKCLVASHGGKYISSLTKQTDFLIVGSKPNKKQIEKAQGTKTKLITIFTLKGMINGTVSPKGAAYEDAPDARGYSQGHNPPTIHCETDIPDEEGEAAAAKVTFSGIR
jgi:BRCT domain type II-containing protein